MTDLPSYGPLNAAIDRRALLIIVGIVALLLLSCAALGAVSVLIRWQCAEAGGVVEYGARFAPWVMRCGG